MLGGGGEGSRDPGGGGGVEALRGGGGDGVGAAEPALKGYTGGKPEALPKMPHAPPVESSSDLMGK